MTRLKVARTRLVYRPSSLAILCLCCFAMALLGLDRFVATAQTGSGGPSGEPSQTAERFVTDTVTVSATKTERERITTPGEVNVITLDELERTQAQSLDDVLRYQVGVDVQLGPRRVGELPVIRGLSGARVLTAIDGVRLNFQSGHQGRLFLDVDSLKQVEVVRGPNSALWGSGALGGVLALTTKDPEDYLRPGATYGGALKLGFQGANTEFLASPTLFGRVDGFMDYLLTFTLRDADDIDLGGDAGTLDNSAEHLYSGLGKVSWSISPYDKVKLSIQGFDELGDVPLNPASVITPETSIVDRLTRQYTYRLGYTRHHPGNPYVDFEGFVYLTQMSIRERRLSDNRRDKIDFDTMGLELRNSSRFDFGSRHRHLLTYGLEGYIDRQDASRAGGPFQQFPDGETESIAFYIQDEINLWDRLFIIPAVRWDYFEQNADDDIDDNTDSKASPKIGGVVKVVDSVYVAANYAEGFRAPTFSELFVGGTHFPGSIFVPNPSLKPEKSKNVDVSVRIQRDRLFFANDSFRASGTYFRNKLDDFIDFEATFNPATRLLEFKPINVQKATIKGWEAELLRAFYPGFELIANYTDITGDNDTDDEPLTDIQPRRGVIGLSYTHVPWYLTVGGRVLIVDDQDRVPEGVSRTAGYTLFDLFAQWEPEGGPWEGLRVDFGIDNVTDKKYRRHLSPLPEAGINPKVAISYVKSW